MKNNVMSELNDLNDYEDGLPDKNICWAQMPYCMCFLYTQQNVLLSWVFGLILSRPGMVAFMLHIVVQRTILQQVDEFQINCLHLKRLGFISCKMTKNVARS